MSSITATRGKVDSRLVTQGRPGSRQPRSENRAAPAIPHLSSAERPDRSWTLGIATSLAGSANPVSAFLHQVAGDFTRALPLAGSATPFSAGSPPSFFGRG